MAMGDLGASGIGDPNAGGDGGDFGYRRPYRPIGGFGEVDVFVSIELESHLDVLEFLVEVGLVADLMVDGGLNG